MKAISVPFRLAPGGLVAQTASYEEIVRGQVIDALMTNQGERVMRPRYGCDIQAAVFDPSDELVRRDAAAFIKTRLEQLVQRAIVRGITIEVADQAPYVVLIDIVYRPSLYSTDTTMTIPVSAEFVARQAALAEAGEVLQ